MIFLNSVKKATPGNLLYQPVGYIPLCVLAVALSACISILGVNSAVVTLALLTGIPAAIAIVAFPRFGVMVLLISAYLIMWFNRMLLNYPAGIVMDLLQVLLIIGFFIQHKYDRDWSFIKSPVSVMISIWMAYNIIQVFNPDAQSKMAWVFTIRNVAVVMITYFLFCYYVDSKSFLRLIIKIWIGLSVFAAVYAIYQEFHGFLPFEENWLSTDGSNSNLYFIAGRWRRFGIFSDPVAAAYNMVISCLLCISLLFSTPSYLKKAGLLFLCALFSAAMLYAGIRGAFIVLPAGLALLFILKLTPKTFIIGLICAAVFAFAVKVPTSNVLLYRFQTAFRPSYDASFNVRKTNQKRIQPYIRSHPIGGGLGATGTWGQRFSPVSYLASFPPDSGFVRVAVETGWVGLLLLCALLLVVLKTGISNYSTFRIMS